MIIENAKFTNSERTNISATVDGVEYSIPTDKGNRFYQEILNQQVTIEPYNPYPMSLDEFKMQKNNEIDQQAEQLRHKYLTPGSGQSMEYDETARQARIVLEEIANSNSPQWADYPMIEAEKNAIVDLGQSPPTIEEIANQIITEQNQWMQVGSQIKRVRRASKMMVNNATTHEEIESIVNNITWGV